MAVTFVTLSLIPKRIFSINFSCVLFSEEQFILFGEMNSLNVSWALKQKQVWKKNFGLNLNFDSDLTVGKGLASAQRQKS
jgi:hypothetical protein